MTEGGTIRVPAIPDDAALTGINTAPQCSERLISMVGIFSSAGAILAGLAMLAASPAALGQQQPGFDYGRTEYASNCAVCHGLDGRGNGPYKPLLTRSPSDLTVLARANNGVFPHQKVYQIIDGRQDVAAHGPREMPIWGGDYSEEMTATRLNVPYELRGYVRSRIIALVDYLDRLQVK